MVVCAGGLSLPGPLRVCVEWIVHFCVWLALHLAAGGGAHQCRFVCGLTRSVNGQVPPRRVPFPQAKLIPPAG